LCQTDGYSHVLAVTCGCVGTLPLFGLLNRRSELAGWATTVSSYLASAVSADPSNFKSLEFARNSQALEFSNKKLLIESRLNRDWMTNFSPGHPRTGREIGLEETPHTVIVQKAVGSIENGFHCAARDQINIPYRGQLPPW